MILAAVVAPGYTPQKGNPLLLNASAPMNTTQSIVCESIIKMLNVPASPVAQTTITCNVKIISMPSEIKGGLIGALGAFSPVPLYLEC